MSKRNLEHIIVSAESGAFECKHCGASHRIEPGLLAEAFLSQGRGFIWMHKHCKPLPVPAPDKQLPLPMGKRRRGQSA